MVRDAPQQKSKRFVVSIRANHLLAKMNHNRTVVYFVGFLIGCILIGWIVHLRNTRREKEAQIPQWIGITLSEQDIGELAPEWIEIAEPLASARLKKQNGSIVKGVFLRHRELKIPLWATSEATADGSSGEWVLHWGNRLLVHSHPGISPSLMQDGFNHVGTPLMAPQPESIQAPVYAVEFDTETLSDLLSTAEMLQSKQLYIAAVEWYPIEINGSTGLPILAPQSE